ncbi:transmembrane protein 45B-like [Glandiceps talaboti]
MTVTEPQTGTFGGHVLPGSLFIIAGIWWAFHVIRSLVTLPQSHLHDNKAHRRQSSRNIRILVFEKPLVAEGIFILVGCVSGICVEASSTEGHVVIDGVFVHVNDLHHITMYAFFALAGLVDILSQSCVAVKPGREKLYLSIAFAVEGLLFYLHGHERPPLDIMLHNLLVFACFGCALFAFIEVWFPQERFLPFIRVGFLLLQGSWFYQISFMLFNPFGDPWDMELESNLAVVPMIFAWHVFGVITFLNIFYFALVHRYRSGYSALTSASCNDVDNYFELKIEAETANLLNESEIRDEE